MANPEQADDLDDFVHGVSGHYAASCDDRLIIGDWPTPDGLTSGKARTFVLATYIAC